MWVPLSFTRLGREIFLLLTAVHMHEPSQQPVCLFSLAFKEDGERKELRGGHL
jgi:hypothetical protein